LTKDTFTFQELKKTNHHEIKDIQDKKFREIDYRDNIQKFVLNPTEVDGKPRESAEAIGNLMKYANEAGHRELAKFIRNNGAKVKLRIGKEAATARLKERATYQFSPLQFWLSSGRASGLPSPVFLTRYDNDLLYKNCVKVGQMSIDPFVDSGWELISMNLFPYAPHLGWHAVNLGLKQMSKFYVATSAGGAIPSERLVDLAGLFKVNGFAGMPSYLRNRFFRTMKDATNYEAPERCVLLLAGEKIYEPVVDEMVETLTEKGAKEVRVVGGYASSESKISFAVQCNRHGPYHNVSPLMLAFELIKFNDDGTYDFVGEDESGHMCLFHLDGTGTVFEGFLLGDVASHQEKGKCPHCEFDGPFFWDIGRTNDAQAQMEIMGISEKKIKGATVNLTALREMLLSNSQIEEVQIEVAKEDMSDPYSMDVLNLYVAPRGPISNDYKSLILDIQQVTKTNAEVTPSVTIIDFEELVERAGGMKFMEIIDNRPKPA